MQTHGPHSHTGQCGWEASQQASVGSAHPRWGPSARRFPRTVSGTCRAGPRQAQRAARALISERPRGVHARRPPLPTCACVHSSPRGAVPAGLPPAAAQAGTTLCAPPPLPAPLSGPGPKNNCILEGSVPIVNSRSPTLPHLLFSFFLSFLFALFPPERKNSSLRNPATSQLF